MSMFLDSKCPTVSDEFAKTSLMRQRSLQGGLDPEASSGFLLPGGGSVGQPSHASTEKRKAD